MTHFEHALLNPSDLLGEARNCVRQIRRLPRALRSREIFAEIERLAAPAERVLDDLANTIKPGEASSLEPYEISPVRALWNQYYPLLCVQQIFEMCEEAAEDEVKRRTPPVPGQLQPVWLLKVEDSIYPWAKGKRGDIAPSPFDTLTAGKILKLFEENDSLKPSIELNGVHLDRLEIERLAAEAKDYEQSVREVAAQCAYLFPRKEDDPYYEIRRLAKLILETPAHSLEDIGLKLIAAKSFDDLPPADPDDIEMIGREIIAFALESASREK